MKTGVVFLVLFFSLPCSAMDSPLIPQEVVLKDKEKKERLLSHKFNPQGTKILIHMKENAVEDLCIYDTSNGDFLEGIPVFDLCGYKWSPKGTYIGIRESEVTHITSETGQEVGHVGVSDLFHVRFSNDEKQIYAGDKFGPSEITVFNPKGIQLAQLAKGRLGPVDPLDEQIASVSSVFHNTSFFSTKTFEKVGEIPARLTCYSPDGSLMGAYAWKPEGGVHSLFNRALVCLREFTFEKRMGPFATINPAKTVLTAYYSDSETNFEIRNMGKAPVHAKHAGEDSVKSFFSWDGSRLITLKHEQELKKDITDFFEHYNHFTRICVSDLDNEKLDREKNVLLPGIINKIFYTCDPDVIFLANGYILNLKTCQIIMATAHLKRRELYTKKAKHLISKMGTYLDMQTKNNEEVAVIRPLKWNKSELPH